MIVCPGGGIGRRARLRALWEVIPVEVQVFSRAPSFAPLELRMAGQNYIMIMAKNNSAKKKLNKYKPIFDSQSFGYKNGIPIETFLKALKKSYPKPIPSLL